MKQEILTQFPWPWLPTLALLIFFLFFVGLITIVSVRHRTGIYARPSQIPLDDEIQEVSRG